MEIIFVCAVIYIRCCVFIVVSQYAAFSSAFYFFSFFELIVIAEEAYDALFFCLSNRVIGSQL